MTDTELLDKLGELASLGYSPGLVNDDNGHWALSFGGLASVIHEPPQDASVEYFVEKAEWKPTIREAILDGLRRIVEEQES